jgi:hypothetical protein
MNHTAPPPSKTEPNIISREKQKDDDTKIDKIATTHDLSTFQTPNPVTDTQSPLYQAYIHQLTKDLQDEYEVKMRALEKREQRAVWLAQRLDEEKVRRWVRHWSDTPLSFWEPLVFPSLKSSGVDGENTVMNEGAEDDDVLAVNKEVKKENALAVNKEIKKNGDPVVSKEVKDSAVDEQDLENAKVFVDAPAQGNLLMKNEHVSTSQDEKQEISCVLVSGDSSNGHQFSPKLTIENEDVDETANVGNRTTHTGSRENSTTSCISGKDSTESPLTLSQEKNHMTSVFPFDSAVIQMPHSNNMDDIPDLEISPDLVDCLHPPSTQDVDGKAMTSGMFLSIPNSRNHE